MHRLSHHDWPARHACTYVAWTYRDDTRHPPHDHDYYELFWVESGRGIHHCNGIERSLESGHLCLIRPEDAHSFRAQDGHKLRFINFAVRPQVWHRIRDTFFEDCSPFFNEGDILNREFSIDLSDRERLRIMASDLASGRWNYTNTCAMLHGVLAMLEDRRKDISASPHLPNWLMNAVRSIETWPHFVGGVPEFVRLAGRSHEHVSRSCRHLMHKTPRDIVNQARLKWAAMQLETTEKKIIDVAQECGFTNLSHFYRLFQASHHATPRTYRLRRSFVDQSTQ